MIELRGYIGLALLFALGIQSSVLADDIDADSNAPTIPSIPAPSPAPSIPAPSPQQSATILFVAPQGTDAPGAGTQTQPFRTIAAALRTNPQPGTTIQLAPGSYGEETGEIFPLKLPPGVKLQGNSNAKGENFSIRGGGKFVSPTFASQNITMLAGSGSQIHGVTLSNGNVRGYALWVESSKDVTIANSKFTNTSHDGIFLTGNANALIVGNIFNQNRGSGISAVGISSGEIRDNIFDNTGFGLSIGQRSQVVLIGNRIVNNVDGIIISNVATPTLRNNLIANNNRNGLVVLKDRDGQPAPDLGTAASPGKNVFRGNKQRDINNISGVAVAAAGNEIDRSRISGPLDTVAANVPSRVPANSAASIPLSVRPTVPGAYPLPPNPIQPVKPRSYSSAVTPARPVNPSTYSSVSVLPLQPNPAEPPTDIIIERELPPVMSVPPAGARVNQPIAIAPAAGVKAVNTAGLRYRVIVPITSSTVKEQIRRIVPGAFASSHNGMPVLQVGAYSDRSQADAQARKLAQVGIVATITAYNE